MSRNKQKNDLPTSDERQPEELIESSDGQRGSTLILTLLVMFLLLGFVALALSRTVTETAVSSNDFSESKTYEASQAGLDDATRDFASVFESKINPNTSDLNTIKNNPVAGFTTDYTITKNLSQVGASQLYTLSDGEFTGLYSLRDEWLVDVKAKEINSGVEVELNRKFYNNRIPLFQFGAFYNDDLELNRPPLFTFGGKVHTNSNLFITGHSDYGIYFKSKVTVAGEIINDIWKTGTTLSSGDNQGKVFFPNAAGADTELATGSASVNCTSGTGFTVLTSNGGRAYPYPNCTKNSNWAAYSARFEGNLKANTPQLRLPVDRLVNADGSKVDLIEMMRRGKNVNDKVSNGTTTPVNVPAGGEDDGVLSKERYANKRGLRISLADSKDELPQCAGVLTACGVQLDAGGGYQPLTMINGSYKTTKINASRLSTTWIKVEMVDFDSNTRKPVTIDVTQDFLSLGVTEPAYDDYLPAGYAYTPINPASGKTLKLSNYDDTQDTRSLIKIQHFWFNHPSSIPAFPTTYISTKSNFDFVGRNSYAYTSANKSACLTSWSNGTTGSCNQTLNVNKLPNFSVGNTAVASGNNNPSAGTNSESDLRLLTFPKDSTQSVAYDVVPFPIQMYDSREGDRRDSNKDASGNDLPANTIYRNGVMSLVDIDVSNLRRFFKGDFDNYFPTTTPYAVSKGSVGLKSTDVKDDRGWVVYFSDRRGDADFDGRYKMEDVNPNGTFVDEDLNNNNTIDVDATYNEAPPVDKTIDNSIAAVTDHTYYRRGVRLINGRILPGVYDSATPANTKGFTFASENGIYVDGNYNAQSVTLPGGNVPAPSINYSPQNTDQHIPASIVGDSVTVLSNNWNDANSFVNPFDTTKRLATDTQIRFAMISGDSLTALTNLSNGDFDGLNGGLHNFLRFVERWNGKRLNYTGSLINLYNSYNNNGRWKCCTTVYDPPIRDWTFDSSFNDPNRLPPGSPYVYYLTLTGFQRVNE